jgi:hypothetical protein
MSDQTERSTSDTDAQEEQKPSPEAYPDRGLGEATDAQRPENEEEGDRSERHAEAADPPRGDPGPTSDA